MAHGGKRPGSGRKRGEPNKKTQAIAAKCLSENISPLEVMTVAMMEAYNKGDYSKAASFAKDLAPYMHPRQASIVHNHGGEIKHNTTVVFVDDFFRRVQNHAPEANGAPAPGIDGLGAHEGNGVRPALGQNGAGPDSGLGGPR